MMKTTHVAKVLHIAYFAKDMLCEPCVVVCTVIDMTHPSYN